MARDGEAPAIGASTGADTLAGNGRGGSVLPADGAAEPPADKTSPLPPVATTSARGLSAKLLWLTVAFVMLAEVLIFVPSVANFRINWLTDRLKSAQLAALATEAVPGGDIPPMLRSELLRNAEVRAVAVKRAGERRMVLPPEAPMEISASYDITPRLTDGWVSALAVRFGQIWDAMESLFGPEHRMLRIVGQPAVGPHGVDTVEIVIPEKPLKAAMRQFGLNILLLSVIISLMTAACVYFALDKLLVRPILRIAANMQNFSRNPEDASRIISPSRRRDELGVAERELAHMQSELSQVLHQKSRLAALGLAVSKINHDLRNLLANVQLLSDRLTAIPDPTVQRFAPKLIAALDRAIKLANDTLAYGRAEEAAPRRELLALAPLAGEVGDGLGLPRPVVDLKIAVDPDLKVDADREQLFRVLTNLARNAVQALETLEASNGLLEIAAHRSGKVVTIILRDNGPGVPDKARAHLFQAFQGSSRKGGTGLGLAISHELVRAHGGRISLLEVDRGAAFEIQIPDRSP